jgi:hypothetical protein
MKTGLLSVHCSIQVLAARRFLPAIALVLLACLALLPGRAAAAVFDDFESYAVGSNLHGQGGWAGWAGNASAGALVSSAFSFSPTRSVNITGASDLVHTFSDATNGQWVFRVMQYIPSTSSGTNYVVLMNIYRPPYGVADLNWSVIIQNNMATGQVISDIGGGATRPMVKDQWVEVRCEINLAANSVSEFYNGQLLSTHAWKVGAGLNEIQALDLFANNAGPVYYDNVSLLGCIPPPSGMVAWYPLDEPNGATAVNDIAGFNNQGTPKPGGSLGSPNGPNAVPGEVGGALFFNTDQVTLVNVPDHPEINFGQGDLSIDAWVKVFPDPISIFVIPIVEKMDRSSGVGKGYAFYLVSACSGSAYLQFDIGNGTTAASYISGCLVPFNNNWHHVAVTVSRSTGVVTLYVDGVGIPSSSPSVPTGNIDNTLSLLIRATRVPGPVWGAIYIDELELFNRALRTNEVAAIFNAGSAGKCKTPCATPLIVNCATNKVVPCGTNWTFDLPTATSCCSTNVTITSTGFVTNGVCPKYITQSWLITDGCGNSNTCSQTVAVVDTTPPVLTCGPSKGVICGSAWSFNSPTAVDACCGTNVTITVLSMVTNGLCPQFITQTWQATDCCSNSITCSQTVTVVDTTPPVINCSGLQSQAGTTTNCNGTIPNLCLPAFYSDACCGISNCVQSPAAGTIVGPGSHPITVTVTDNAGNSSQCVVTYTVVQGQIVLSLFSGINNFAALGANFPSGTTVVIGPTFIPGSWLANSPNSQWIGPGINALGIPNISTYHYRATFNLSCTNGARITGQWATDNGGAILLNGAPKGNTPYIGFTAWTPVTITSGFQSGLNTLDFYVTNNGFVTGLRTELLGTANCCSNACIVLRCPTNIMVCTCSNSVNVAYQPTAIDTCGVPVTVTCTPPSNSSFPLGTTLVTCTATDPLGNSASCTFTVTVVKDTSPPVIHCPPNLLLYTCTNGAYAYYKVWATDGCDTNVSISCTPPSGTFFPIGVTPVTCTATDDCGHISSCTFTVTVSTILQISTFPAGLHDNFALPVDPTFRRPCLNTAYPGALWKNFDDTTINRFIGHSFVGLPAGIVGAQLTVRMKPLPDIPNNDDIYLGLNTPCNPPSWAYSSLINALPGAGGTWTINPATIFTLNLGNLPGGGNLIPKLAADRFLDVLIQDDTAVDWMELQVTNCPPRRHFFGLPHIALGQAQLADRADADSPNVTRLTLSNLGSSGADGVEIAFGAPNAHMLDVFYENPQGDGTITFTSLGYFGGQPGQPVQRSIIDFAGEEQTYSYDVSPLGATTFTMRIFDGSRLVYESHGNPSGGPSLRTFKYEHLPTIDHCMGYFDEDFNYHAGYDYSTATRIAFNVLGGGLTVTGDLVLIIPENPQILPEALSAMTIQTSGQITELNIRAETVADAHTTAAALGDGIFEPAGGNLTVTNLGTNGQDGVTFSMRTADSFNFSFATIDPMDECPPECLLTGATLTTHVLGSLGGVPGTLLDTLTLTKAGSNIVISADFSPIGSFSQRVLVLSNGVVVADFPGHTGVVGTASDWPNSLGKLALGTPCRRGGWPTNTIFTIDGSAYVGDELRVLAEPPAGTPQVDYLTDFQITVSGLPELTVTGANVAQSPSLCPPAALYFQQEGGFIILWWVGENYRLQTTTALGATASWSDVAGTLPVVLPVSGGIQFFRLICR